MQPPRPFPVSYTHLLKAALADAQRAAALEDTRTEREKRLAADLYAHPELIPIEGILRCV